MEMLSTPTARAPREITVASPVSASNKTILLVHNSSRASSPFKAALSARGYHVIHAESGEAAFRVWAKMTTPVDLFLADIVLGKESGVERLVQMMQAENPRLRVLFVNDLDQSSGPLLSPRYPQQLVAVVENCLA